MFVVPGARLSNQYVSISTRLMGVSSYLACPYYSDSILDQTSSFSLRTLLIATTLIAVVLGLIVWLLSP